MSGSNALQIADPNADNLLAQAPSWADAAQSVAGTIGSGVDVLGQWLAAQRAKSAQAGLWNDQTGLPTGAGIVNAAQQYGNALMMGTTVPGDAPGFSLEKVQRRPLAPPNEHIWKIKDPTGGDAGTIDTTWNPDTGNLHIEDFQSEGGPNTLGQAAIRQLRSALLEQYPGVQSLSGLRISGATYADRNSGSGAGLCEPEGAMTSTDRLAEMAAEIERLRARVAELEAIVTIGHGTMGTLQQPDEPPPSPTTSHPQPHHTMSEAQEYARALTAYRKALTRLKAAKAALVAAKAKPPSRTYTLAEIDAMFPPSPHIGHTIKWPSTPPHDER